MSHLGLNVKKYKMPSCCVNVLDWSGMKNSFLCRGPKNLEPRPKEASPLGISFIFSNEQPSLFHALVFPWENSILMTQTWHRGGDWMGSGRREGRKWRFQCGGNQEKGKNFRPYHKVLIKSNKPPWGLVELFTVCMNRWCCYLLVCSSLWQGPIFKSF